MFGWAFSSQWIGEKNVSKQLHNTSLILVGLDINYHTKRTPSPPPKHEGQKCKNKIQSEEASQRLPQTNNTNSMLHWHKSAFNQTPNNILVKHLVNGLFGTLTTSCSSGPFRLSADTTGMLSGNERLSKKKKKKLKKWRLQGRTGATGEFKTSSVAITGCQKMCLIEND